LLLEVLYTTVKVRLTNTIQVIADLGHARECESMARYFFDLHNSMASLDEEGVELPDLNAALARALFEARAMIQASVAETGRIDLHDHLDVRSDSGEVLYVLHFEDAVTVQRGDQVLSRASALRSV
jgi:hypothetical protein